MKKLLVTVAFSSLFPATALSQVPIPEQGAPPTNLTERDGHWTANESPSNTENFQTHVVQPGDTLWGLAVMYMDNGLLWPQLWEINEHIINPHWIYPEDIILIQIVQQISEVAPPPPPEPEPEPQQAQVPVQLPNLTPEPDVSEAPIVFDPPPVPAAPTVKTTDLYCSGFISANAITGTPAVIARAPGTSTEGYFAVRGDYVYIDRGASDGVQPGDRFTAIRPTRDVDSPRDRVGDLGRHYLEIAQLETVTVQNNFAMARIMNSCDGLGIGDSLIPFAEITVPEPEAGREFSATMRGSGEVTGAVAAALSLHMSIDKEFGTSTGIAGRSSENGPGRLSAGVSGEGEIVYIDLGTRDGIEAGDVMLISRPIAVDQFGHISGETARLLAAQRKVFGELIVLKVQERAATALVTYSEDAVSRGDLVEPR